MHIFVDLDGVLANFCQAACDLHAPGTIDEYIVNYGRVVDINAHPYKQLEIGLGVSYEEFWDGITNAGETFWVNMDILPYAIELWERLNDALPGQVSILTSPGAGVTAAESASGKYQWVFEHLGEDAPYRTIVCPAPLKHHLAQSAGGSNILIDDYDKNVEQWNAAGGRAIQWPSMQFHQRHADRMDVNAAVMLVANLIVGGAV